MTSEILKKLKRARDIPIKIEKGKYRKKSGKMNATQYLFRKNQSICIHLIADNVLIPETLIY